MKKNPQDFNFIISNVPEIFLSTDFEEKKNPKKQKTNKYYIYYSPVE